jgi:hypothetical protein
MEGGVRGDLQQRAVHRPLPARDGRERGQDGFDQRLAAGLVLRGGAVHAVQERGGGDGGDADVLVGFELFFQPGAARAMAVATGAP